LALKQSDFEDTEEAHLILTELASMTPSNHLEETLKSYGQEALTRISNRDVVQEYAGLFLDGKAPE